MKVTGSILYLIMMIMGIIYFGMLFADRAKAKKCGCHELD